MPYAVMIHKKAQDKFNKIREQELKDRLREVFKLLSEPFNLDTIKIHGEECTHRTRVGKYRILEVIRDGVVYIVDFDIRGKVYK